MMTVWLYI